MKFATAALCLAAIAMAGCAEPPTRFPRFDPGQARPLLVVAQLDAGDYLPQREGVTAPNLVSFDPPPFWFRADVAMTVYGQFDGSHLHAVTTSHYGIGPEYYFDDYHLLRLVTDGKQYLLQRYALALVREKTSGERHIIVGDKPAWWLPCSVEDLREELRPDEFDGLRPSANNERRYTISMTRLKEHLGKLKPDNDAMSCGGK